MAEEEAVVETPVSVKLVFKRVQKTRGNAAAASSVFARLVIDGVEVLQGTAPANYIDRLPGTAVITVEEQRS